ncbi:MAG: hypothetical protein J6Z25_03850 [Opitutales bacterium]|nr:hypothetical protein [Opitutales bacterium]
MNRIALYLLLLFGWYFSGCTLALFAQDHEASNQTIAENRASIPPKQTFYPLLETREKAFFVRPFIARYEEPQKIENTFLYPFGQEIREPQHRHGYCLFSLLRYDRQTDESSIKQNIQLFPFYFYQQGYGGSDYKALWPIGGTVKNFFGKQQTDWCGWPLYVRTQKPNETNHWFPYPLINLRKGKTSGFAFYPIGGHFRSPEKDLRYFLWPLGYDHRFFKTQHVRKGFLPFYAYEEKPNVRDVSIFWPFFGHRWESQPNYEEHRILWPLWVQGKGEQRNVNRWAPFYTYSQKKHRSKTWYFWPLIKEQRWREGAVDIYQEQALYFLFWHQEQFAYPSKRFLGSKTHFWPFYSYWDNGQGRKQMQMLSPFEVFFQNHARMRDIYAPLFNLFRYEEDGPSIRQSFLFNTFQEYRCQNTHEVDLRWLFLLRYTHTRQEKCFSLLKGLLEYKKIGNKPSWRLFWIPIRSHKNKPKDIKML